MPFIKIKRTYNFRDKDPVVDELRTLVQDAGLGGKRHVSKIAYLADLAPGTVEALFFGETRIPRNSTVMQIATSLGYERRWARAGGKWNLEAELALAKEHRTAERARRKKYDEAHPEEKRARKKKK